MALLDTASLIVTPNGYKASKLYSIVPSDGTGDMAFSRTGNTATRVNSSGLIATVNADIPRLDYLGSTCPKLLLEPQRTNLLTYSNDFDNAVWTKSGVTITANTVTSPDGTTNADKIVESSANASHFIYRAITGSSRTFTVFAKSAGRNWIGILSDNGTTFFNISTGVLGTIASGVTAKIESYNNGWYRCSVTSTHSTYGASVYVCSANNVDTYLGDGTSGVYVYASQIEVGLFPTSYIPTTTASVTRNPDSLTKSNVYTNGYITSFGGTWFIDLANNNGFTRDSAKIGMWIGESNSNSINTGFSSFNIRTLSGTAQKLQISFYNGTIGTTLYQTTQVDAKIAITFNGTTANIFVNGTKVVNSVSAGITLANFQYFNFQEDVPYYIKSTALFASPLSDTNCITLTTL
jgi:hypothetical protein